MGNWDSLIATKEKEVALTHFRSNVKELVKKNQTFHSSLIRSNKVLFVFACLACLENWVKTAKEKFSDYEICINTCTCGNIHYGWFFFVSSLMITNVITHCCFFFLTVSASSASFLPQSQCLMCLSEKQTKIQVAKSLNWGICMQLFAQTVFVNMKIIIF